MGASMQTVRGVGRLLLAFTLQLQATGNAPSLFHQNNQSKLLKPQNIIRLFQLDFLPCLFSAWIVYNITSSSMYLYAYLGRSLAPFALFDW